MRSRTYVMFHYFQTLAKDRVFLKTRINCFTFKFAQVINVPRNCIIDPEKFPPELCGGRNDKYTTNLTKPLLILNLFYYPTHQQVHRFLHDHCVFHFSFLKSLSKMETSLLILPIIHDENIKENHNRDEFLYQIKHLYKFSKFFTLIS